MVILLSGLFAAAVAFNEITTRMYFRSVENAGDDAMAEIDAKSCRHDIAQCLAILNKHYDDNDKHWRWRKR